MSTLDFTGKAKQDFDSLGRGLFGTKKNGGGWKLNFSRLSGTNYDTVKKWGNQNPIPPAVLFLMRELAKTRSVDTLYV